MNQKKAEPRYYKDDIIVEDAGPHIPDYESSGNLARGHDKRTKSRPLSFRLKTDGVPLWDHCFLVPLK